MHLMAQRMLFTAIFLLYATRIETHPIQFLRRFSEAKSDSGSWIWGWAWGADSSVSVVDRAPPLTFASRPAAFGLELESPLLGYVIPVSSFAQPCAKDASLDDPPNTGCPDLCVTGPLEPEPTDTWIALVQRGDCPFVHKVREAQRLGAKAVVVGGDDPNISGNPDALVNMYSQEDASDVEIASCFIRYSDYTMLSSLIAASNTSHSGLKTLSLLITTEYSAWEWYSPIMTFVIILLLPSSLTFITLLIHRIRTVRAAQRDRAPEDIVKSLPWRVWTGSGWEKHEGMLPGQEAVAEQGGATQEPGALAEQRPESPKTVDETEAAGSPSHVVVPSSDMPWYDKQFECAICLSEFVKGDRVRVLPCHHIFHIDEVDEWLIHRKKLCPICKTDVTQPLHAQQDEAEGTPAATEGDDETPNGDRTPATEQTPLLRDRDEVDGS